MPRGCSSGKHGVSQGIQLRIARRLHHCYNAFIFILQAMLTTDAKDDICVASDNSGLFYSLTSAREGGAL